MNPNRLNAAQLLMSVSIHENGKICQKIQTSGFSRELQSMAFSPQPGQEAAPAPGTAQPSHPGITATAGLPGLPAHSRSGDCVPDLQGTAAPRIAEPAGLASSTTAAATGPTAVKPALNRARQAAGRPVRADKPQLEDQPAFTHPLLLDKILAQLQFPAEVRQKCLDAIQKQGSLTVQALLTALAGSQTGGRQGLTPPVVSAADVRGLVHSMKLPSRDGSLLSGELKLKQMGEYSFEELRDLFRAMAQRTRRGPASRVASGPVQAPIAGAPGPMADGSEAAAQVQGEPPPEGQLQRLSASRLPSFTEPPAARPTRIGRALQGDDPERQVHPPQHLPRPELESRPGRQTHPTVPPPSPTAVEIDPREGASPVPPDPTSGAIPASTPREAIQSQQVHARAVPAQAPASHPEEGALPMEHAPRGSAHQPGSPNGQESIPDGRIVSLSNADSPITDGAPRAEEPAGTLTEFQAEAMAPGDHPDGLEQRGSGGSSQQDRDRGSPAQTFQETRGTDGTFDVSMPENEAAFRVPAPSGKPDSIVSGEGRSERISLHQPEWAQKVSEQVAERARSGKSSLVVEFEPQDLGQMTLRIEADRRQVTAWISTQTEEARAILLQGSSALQKHLADHGLTLGQLSVSVSDGRAGGRGAAEHRESRRASRIGGKATRDLSSGSAAPGIHHRVVGQGGNQSINLVA